MRIVIAGGSGFLGRALAAALRASHDVRVLTRAPRERGDVEWFPEGGSGDWTSEIADADAVVNLAGESIADGRWTAARREAIRSSRTHATRALVAAIQAAPRPPGIFVSSSAVGYYGDRGAEVLTEASTPGNGFLASVCVDWETAARAAGASTRLTIVRSGVVLAGEGGALPKMALPFRFFVGGPAGSGEQYISWIALPDWVALVRAALERDTLAGALNATAPEPVTNRAFARTLGRVMGRPAVMPTPAFALRLALGDMADALILGGQRVLPACATAAGLTFEHPTLESALRAIYR